MRYLLLILCFIALVLSSCSEAVLESPYGSVRTNACDYEVHEKQVWFDNFRTDVTDGEMLIYISMANWDTQAVPLPQLYITTNPSDLRMYTYWDTSKNQFDLDQKMSHLKSFSQFSFITTSDSILRFYLTTGCHILDMSPAIDLSKEVLINRGKETNYAWTNSITGEILGPGFIRSSKASGFYNSSIDVGLLHPNPNLKVSYETTGASPDSNSFTYRIGDVISKSYKDISHKAMSMVASTPDPDDFPKRKHYRDWAWEEPSDTSFKSFVIRYAAVQEGEITGQVWSETFTIHPGFETKLPSLQIIMDPFDLVDYEKGIYIPGMAFDTSTIAGKQWHPPGNYSLKMKKQAHFQYFNKEGQLLLSYPGIVSNHGFAAIFPNKGLRMMQDPNEYHSSIKNHFFDSEVEAYNRIILRSAGNDANKSFIRDIFLQELAQDMDMEVQRHQSVSLLINGEYWGIYHLREKYDRYYFAEHFGTSPDSLDLIEYCGKEVKEGSADDYLNIIDRISRVPLTAELYAALDSQFDISNVIDYFLFETFFANFDWPGPGGNYRLWRDRGGDNKWRFVAIDMDWSTGFRDSKRAYNMITHALGKGERIWANPECATILFEKLMESDEFQQRLAAKYCKYKSTLFNSVYLHQKLQEYEDYYEYEMYQHIARWHHPSDQDHWCEHLNVMRLFFKERALYYERHLAEEMRIPQALECQ